MNDTFEDRLWSVLIDEVRAPSLPSFDEPSPLGRPRPVRRRTPLLLAGGIAAAAALLAGVLVLGGDDGVSTVETADTAPTTTAAPDLPYLTLADPVGGVVQRVSLPRDDQRRYRVRRIGAAPGVADIELTKSRGFMTTSGFNTVATIGGIEVRELDPSNSGGVPMDLYHFDTPDGSSWVVSGLTSGADGLAELRALLEAATFSDGGMSVAPPFEQFTTPFNAPKAWSVQDNLVAVIGFHDSTSDIGDLPGAAVTVRGHEGREQDNMLTWRETPDLVVSVVSSMQSMTATGVPPTPLADRVAAAERLVPGTRALYEALPVWRGASDSNVVVLQAPGRQVGMVDFWVVDADGKQISSGGGSLGDAGSALPMVPGAAEVWLWNGDDVPGTSAGSDAIRTAPPACAVHVVVPPAGQPPVEVTIDPDCTG
ncbi:MAG TPA: hypothetical protein PLS46_05040 [Microthrixaceae bacterium]|jgi:hypothetical protein|nr:hypothetical protein [Microthrixaceae bacterium]